MSHQNKKQGWDKPGMNPQGGQNPQRGPQQNPQRGPQAPQQNPGRNPQNPNPHNPQNPRGK